MTHMPTSHYPESRRESRAGSAGTQLWGRNLKLILLLLAVWATLTFVPAWFAARLLFPVLGWPFSYWMAAYGAPLGYLAIIVAYARIMNGAE